MRWRLKPLDITTQGVHAHLWEPPGMSTLRRQAPMEPLKGWVWHCFCSSWRGQTYRHKPDCFQRQRRADRQREKPNSDRGVCFRWLAWHSARLSCLVINAWTRAEALKFGSDVSSKSHGPAFQLKSETPAEAEAARCPDLHQLHSEWWLCLWGNELFLCQDATNAPKGALSLRSYFSQKKTPLHNSPPWNPVPDLHPFVTFLENFSMLKIDLLAYA